MMTITLPFPDPRLNPNRSKGTHWASTAALRKVARETGASAAILEMTGRIINLATDVPMWITFVQPDRRARDRDNLLAALKPSLDGIADALGINDSRFEPITISREYGAKPGCVRITIGDKS